MQVLPPYTQTRSPFATFLWVLLWLGIAVGVGLGYGYMSAIGPLYFLPAMTAGVAGMLLLLVLVLPAPRAIPQKTIYTLYFFMIAFHILIPEYIALFLPGLPWMNPMRITAISLTLLIGYLMFSRKDFQADVVEISTRYWLIFFGGTANVLVGAMILPIMGGDIIKLSSAAFDLLVYFVAVTGAAYLCWKIGFPMVQRAQAIVVWATAALLVVGTLERMTEMVLWRPLIPAGFGGDDATLIQSIINSKARDGIHRVQAIFSNPLLFGEFLGISSTLVLAAALASKKYFVRVLLFALYTYCVFGALVFPNARLALVAVIAGHGVLACLWLLHWKRYSSRQNLLADVGLLAIPAMGLGLMVLLAFSRRFQAIIFGGGARSGSNEARGEQWALALGSFRESPIFGFGYSEALSIAGTIGQNQTRTLDSWYINVLLDSGVLGTFLYAAAFFVAVYRSCQLSLISRKADALALMALTGMMVAKMTINGVLSLTHNHVLLFFAYGIVIGASLRYQEQLKTFKWFPGRNDKVVSV